MSVGDCIHECDRILVTIPRSASTVAPANRSARSRPSSRGALPENWRPFIRINYAYGDGLATVDQLVEDSSTARRQIVRSRRQAPSLDAFSRSVGHLSNWPAFAVQIGAITRCALAGLGDRQQRRAR